VISLGAPRPSFLCRNTREGLERKVSPLKTSHVTGYGRCEELFTLFFSFMKTKVQTQNTSRSAPEATLMHIPVIVRLACTLRPASNRRDALH
jgi:hypothetical protein